MRFKDKVAIVTGGARGIGASVARGIAEEGGKVAILDIREDLAKETETGINSKGGQAIALKIDVTRSSEVKKAVAEVIHRFGKIDVLVSNAGWSRFGRFVDTTEQDWDQVIAVNLKAVFLCCQAAGRIMIPQKSGRIINISSVGGRVALPRLIVYCAAKGGVEMITRVLAVEWAQHNILISSLAPTYVETDMTEGLRTNPRIFENMLRQAPLGRLVRPEELVGAAIYLASDASTYHTGQTLYVDGGWMAS